MTADPTQPWAARPRWRIQRGEEIALGPGKVDLLEAIASAGSISAAARALGMSYRRAWLLVEAMNHCFERPLVTTSTYRQQGARLTDDGKAVLELYRHAERESERTTHETMADIVARLKR